MGILFNKQFVDTYQVCRHNGTNSNQNDHKTETFFCVWRFLIFLYKLWDSWNISVLEISWSTSFVKLREAPEIQSKRNTLGPSRKIVCAHSLLICLSVGFPLVQNCVKCLRVPRMYLLVQVMNNRVPKRVQNYSVLVQNRD